MNEIILHISMDDVDKLRYALDHTQDTGSEYIDGVLSTFNDVLKEELSINRTEEHVFFANHETKPDRKTATYQIEYIGGVNSNYAFTYETDIELINKIYEFYSRFEVESHRILNIRYGYD